MLVHSLADQHRLEGSETKHGTRSKQAVKHCDHNLG